MKMPMSTSDWSEVWPLPTSEDVQDKLLLGRTLTAADRLAMFRDGQLIQPQAQSDLDRALQLAAKGAFEQGNHGQRRPELEWHLQTQRSRDDHWPLQPGEAWPAWEGEDWETFAHRAHVAVWMTAGANPWVAWAEDRHGPWGLPEILLAAADVGLWRRVMAHPATPDLAELAQRRLGPPKRGMGMAHVPWLHAAAALADPAILTDLLARGMDPQAQDDQGRTTLFYAANPEQLARLLEAGGSLDALDHQQESLRGYLARTKPDFLTAWAPVLDRFNAPQSLPVSNPVLSVEEIQEAFGQGAQGRWPEVQIKMDRAGPAWNDWRQGITLKNGVVRNSTWLGYVALQLLSPTTDPRKQVSFDWHHNQCHILDAAEKTLAEATSSTCTHETLPGLSDGLLWTWLLRASHVYQPVRLPGMDDLDYRDSMRALERRYQALVNDWEDRASQGGSRLSALSRQLEGMRQNLNTWATPGFWRDAMERVADNMVGHEYSTDNLLTDTEKQFPF